MSKGKVRVEELSRIDESKEGTPIPIYRRKDVYFSTKIIRKFEQEDERRKENDSTKST